MKNKQRAVLVLSLCALVLGGALIALWREPTIPGRQEERPAETLYSITQIPLTSLVAVRIKNPQSTYAVLQTPEGIEVITSTSARFDNAQLRTLLYAACNLSSTRKITDTSVFSQYGMDIPEAEFSLVLTDGSERYYQLLTHDPVEGNRYLYSKADNAIYLLPAQVAALFLRSEQDFLSHTIFPVSTESDFAKVEHIEVRLGGERAYTIEQTDTGFFLTTPVRHRLSAAAVRQKLLENVARLYADQVLDIGEGWDGFGFDQYFLSLALRVAERDYRALFVVHAEQGLLMGDPETKIVYRLEDDAAYLLAQDYIDLMNGQVLTCALGDLRSIHLSAEGLPDVLLEISGSGASLVIRRDGEVFHDKAQRAAVAALNALPVVGELSQHAEGREAYTLTLQWAEGSTDVFSFLAIGDGLCAVREYDTMRFLTTIDAAQTLLEALTAADAAQ